MLNYMRYRYKLWQLQKKQRESSFLYTELETTARNRGKSIDEINTIQSEGRDNDWLYEGEINQLQDEFYRQQARIYFVPYPAIDGNTGAWKESRAGWQLTLSERAKLRKAIQAEQRELREQMVAWATLAIGVIGAITGLTAVWKN
jgi:hypothetical protein